MTSEEINAASSQLSAMTEAGVTAWLRTALIQGAHPFPTGRDEFPASALSGVPAVVSLDLAGRFRAALANLLVDFASRPATWGEDEAEELLALASLLGTGALPGREPWDLGFAVSLAPLVSANWEAFEPLALKLRARVLALLRSGPVHLHPGFWMDLAARSYKEFATVAWRGLLRDDWLTACSRIMRRIPETDTAREAMRNHAAYAARQIKAPRGEEKLAQLEAALPLAKPGIAKALRDSLAAEGIRLQSLQAKSYLVPLSVRLSKMFEAAKMKLGCLGPHPLGLLVEVESSDAPLTFLLLDAFELAIRNGDDEQVNEFAQNYARAASAIRLGGPGQRVVFVEDRETVEYNPDAPDTEEPRPSNVLQGDFGRFAENMKPDIAAASGKRITRGVKAG